MSDEYEKLYAAAVKGRSDFREAYSRERAKCQTLRGLLAEARARIPDWSTGVNDALLSRIDRELAGEIFPNTQNIPHEAKTHI